MSVKSTRAWLFKLQRKSEAKTVHGKIRALLKFYQRKEVEWVAGGLAKDKDHPDGPYGYCLQGAMIALGFREDTGKDFIGSKDELSQCILRSANDLGWQTYKSVWRVNDNTNEENVMKILNHALEMDC